MLRQLITYILTNYDQQIIALFALIVGAIGVQVLRWLGMSVTANTQAQIDYITRQGIAAVAEAAARAEAAGKPLTGKEKAAIAERYILSQLWLHRSQLLSVILGRFFKSFRLPSAADIASKVDANLAVMGEGATVMTATPPVKQ